MAIKWTECVWDCQVQNTAWQAAVAAAVVGDLPHSRTATSTLQCLLAHRRTCSSGPVSCTMLGALLGTCQSVTTPARLCFGKLLLSNKSEACSRANLSQ